MMLTLGIIYLSIICGGLCNNDDKKVSFIEIGLNRGQTFKELVSSEQPDRNLIKPILRNVLGHDSDTKLFCLHGFEANQVFTQDLKKLEAELKQAGFCAQIFTETAAGEFNGNQTLYIDGKQGKMHGPTKKYYAEGSTLDPHSGHRLQHMTSVSVKTVDIKEFLYNQTLYGGLVILRMDIEGAEYQMLEYLLSPSGRFGEDQALIICAMKLLIIEFHSKRQKKITVLKQKFIKERIDAQCPQLRVVLDPANYLVSPFKETWPLPKEWFGVKLEELYNDKDLA